MALSLSQLSTPPTREQIVQWMLDRLSALGFPVTGWQPGRIANSLLNAFATVASFVVQVATETAANGFSGTASGSGLTLYSRSRFDNERTEALPAIGNMVLTNAGTSPYTIGVGAALIRDSVGTEFLNTTGGTLNAGSALTITVKAIVAGQLGNIQNNSVLSLVTPLAGVTVANPGPGDVDGDGFDDAWTNVQTGVDEESDTELDQRNATKWGLLAVEKTKTAYENLALKQAGVSKTLIIDDNPRGPGTVDVYVAAATSLVSTAEIEDAQIAFADYTMGTDPDWPIIDYPFGDDRQTRAGLFHPAVEELFVQGVVNYDPQYTETEISEAMSTALTDFVALTPIGGRSYPPTLFNVITIGDLLQVMEGVTGVRTVTLENPTGNYTVPTTTLVTPPADWITGRLTLVAVTS